MSAACGCDSHGLRPVDEAIGELLSQLPPTLPVEDA